jgi:pimeloyl-ACP methyl ester carboxylesterase
LDIDNEHIVCEAHIKSDADVIILHGAGTSNRKRYYSLAKAILSRGLGVLLFDFSGHGDSSGKLEDLSLERRRIQAQKAIDTLIPQESKLYLIGFSMSGQTVCDLLPLYSERIPAILLGCPGIYTESVQKKPFGGGEFTQKIRQTGSWNDSLALDELSMFNGRTVIAIGENDPVIPREVILSLKRSAKHLSYAEYPNVDHQLAVWLAGHEHEQGELLDLLLTG